MRRVLVTGATGFVGPYLVRRLKESGYEVLSLSRRGGEGFVRADLNHPDSYREAVQTFRPHLAYHLAWEGLPDYGVETCRRNLDQGLKLYDILLESGCSKIITTGTCWEYGNLKGKISVSDEGNPLNVFAATKQSLRRAGKSMASGKSCHFIWARPFFIYGRGQRETSLIPSMIEGMKEGRDPEIRNPESVNDYVYVKDVADCLLALAGPADFPDVVNIGTGRPYRTDEVARIVKKLMTEGSEVFVRAEPTYSPKENGFWADMDEITRATGWRPHYDLVDGIRGTIQQERKNL